MTVKKIVYVYAAVVLVGAYAADRYFARPKTTTQVITTDTTKKTETKQRTHTTIVKRPDGTEVTTVDTTTDTTTDEREHSREVTKVVESSQNKKNLNVSLLVSYDLTQPGIPDIGISVSKEIIGPVTVGAWGMRSGVVGLSVGINF